MNKIIACLCSLVLFSAAAMSESNFFCDLRQSHGMFEIRLAESFPKSGLVRKTVYGRQEVVYLYSKIEITRADVERAAKINDEYGRPAVEVVLTAKGYDKMLRLTKANLHKQVAIIVDDQVVFSPMIDAPMSSHRLTITGYVSEQEATNLAACINRK